MANISLTVSPHACIPSAAAIHADNGSVVVVPPRKVSLLRFHYYTDEHVWLSLLPHLYRRVWHLKDDESCHAEAKNISDLAYIYRKLSPADRLVNNLLLPSYVRPHIMSI
eukprot:scaffold243309_cov19-Prasinocladus_malaysianus.AAC.1